MTPWAESQERKKFQRETATANNQTVDCFASRAFADPEKAEDTAETVRNEQSFWQAYRAKDTKLGVRTLPDKKHSKHLGFCFVLCYFNFKNNKRNKNNDTKF